MSRILIIEDETSIADLERDYLELSGFTVEIENDGKKGLERALQKDIDLLILDLMLPGENGFEICRIVREKKNIPIIMVSARKDDIDKIRGLGLGADDYMTKPFSPSELVARVKAHLARYERLLNINMQANDIIEIRGLKIDRTARRVWIDGVEKAFTTKEFDLLSYLAQNPDHVFTKDELFREIWDMDSIGEIATVTVHIKKIREKIEKNSAKPEYIETIWGVGSQGHPQALSAGKESGRRRSVPRSRSSAGPAGPGADRIRENALCRGRPQPPGCGKRDEKGVPRARVCAGRRPHAGPGPA